MRLLIILFCVFIVSCLGDSEKKIYIKSVKVSDDVRIDWYVYSSIGSLAPDYLQISNNNKTPFFISFFLSDIKIKNDSLLISLWKNKYEKLDESNLKGLKIAIDTNGKAWNGAASRFGRLKNARVNIEQPHYVDAYCPNGECYNW